MSFQSKQIPEETRIQMAERYDKVKVWTEAQIAEARAIASRTWNPRVSNTPFLLLTYISRCGDFEHASQHLWNCPHRTNLSPGFDL